MLDLQYLIWLKNLPPEIATMIIAMIPVTELRASIPIALGVYDLSIFSAIFWSVLGDIIPMFFILIFIGPVSRLLMRKYKFWNKFFTWLFERTRYKFQGKHDRFGELALIIFVAIPLPVTGSWTGSLASFLFGIPIRRAFVLITIGVILSAVIVSFIATGVFSFFRLLI